MGKALFIYDNKGKIFHWSYGDEIDIPDGLQHIIIEEYDFENKPIESIDVSSFPHTPVYRKTEEEIKISYMTLDEYKSVRQEENKAALAKFLKENPLLWIDGMYYGVTEQDQNEMLTDKSAYDFKHSIGQTDWKLEWHNTKSACREFTVEEFGALLNAIVDYVYPFRKLQEQYKEMIYNSTTKEEVSSIILNYSKEG